MRDKSYLYNRIHLSRLTQPQPPMQTFLGKCGACVFTPMSRCIGRISQDRGGPHVPARSVCLVTLSLSEAEPGSFDGQLSFVDLYHTSTIRVGVISGRIFFVAHLRTLACVE